MHNYRFIAFDTLCQLQVCDAISESVFESLASQVEKSSRDVEATLSMYDDNSELSRLCSSSSIDSWIPISKMLHAFLLENKRMYEWTNGCFDPTIGSAVKLWDFLANEPSVPSSNMLTEQLQYVGFDKIRIDSDLPRVKFYSPIKLIDPGASGKGFALKQAVNILRGENIKSACLNYGGNIYVIGYKLQYAEPIDEQVHTNLKWKIGIINPNDTYIQHIEELSDEGISTSSWYEHGFKKDNKVYHHIIDPRTGYPVELDFDSVSIISNDAFYTDLVSTPFFLLGAKEGAKLIERIHKELNGKVKLRSVIL